MRYLEQAFYTVSILGAFVGGIYWLADTNELAASTGRDVQILKAKEDEHTKQFEEIRIRLAHIEDALK